MNPKTSTILFLHGWGGSTKSFEALTKSIEAVDTNYNCVSLDFPGFGKEPMPPLKGWNTDDYAKWLHQEIKKLLTTHHSPLTLYGHSFGCRVIVRLLNKHPDIADRIVLTGAAGIKWPPSTKQKMLQIISRIGKPIMKPILHIMPQNGPIGHIRRKILRFCGAKDWEECPEELKPTLQKVLAEDDFRDTLPNITCPTLLIWGAEDTYTPLRSAKVYQEKIKGSKLIVYPDGRHGIHYTHTDLIAKQVVDFLGK